MRRAAALMSILGLAALAVPGARAAGWSKVPVPKDSGLQAVSCVSTRSCEAVGSWLNRPIAEHWNGARWSMQSIHAPAGAYASVLVGISCRSSRECVAVGEYFQRSSSVSRPLIERFDGRHWSIESAPSRAVAGGAHNLLSAVACPAAKVCIAVGNTRPRGRRTVPGTPLIERWDGQRWRLAGAPAASGPLTSVSCTSQTACMAVGGAEIAQGQDNNPQISDVTVSMRWDGRRWSMEAIPTPAGADGARLLGVSCITTSECLGVGSSLENDSLDPVTPVEVDHAMTGSWDGSAWSTETLPLAAGPPTGENNPLEELYAVSCASRTACVAVGIARDNTGRIGPLVARWTGAAWAQRLLRVGAPVALKSVSCVSARWCMAVGPTRAARYTG
jgi:hypothetical protein